MAMFAANRIGNLARALRLIGRKVLKIQQQLIITT